MNEVTSKTRTPRAPNTKPKLWIVLDENRKAIGYVKAVDVRVARDEDSYAIIDGKIAAFMAPSKTPAIDVTRLGSDLPK